MALPNDVSRTATALAKLEASNPNYDSAAGKNQAARQAWRSGWQFKTANVATNASLVGNVSEKRRMKNLSRVLGVWFSPDFAMDVSANASNFTHIALKEVYANGVMGNIVANAQVRPVANGGTGNLAVGTVVQLTVLEANYRVAQGVQLAPDISQSGGGLTMAAGSWTVDYEDEGLDSAGNIVGYPV